MLGELIPCGGGDSIPLMKPKLLIGRRSSCDITLRFPNVSSHHCELELLNGYWIVRDLGSRNGIKVNGERHESKWLMPGDVLSVARHRYEVAYTPQADAPPPEEESPFALSLMEKAGLQKRKPRPQREDVSLPPAARRRDKPAQNPKSAPEEDQALKWLSEDEDPVSS